MFVFKKNSYAVMLVAKYAFKDCLISLVCMLVIPVLFAGCGCLFGDSIWTCQLARLLVFSFCTALLHNNWGSLLGWVRKSLRTVVPRRLFGASGMLNAGRSVMLGVASCLAVYNAGPGMPGTGVSLWGVVGECRFPLVVVAVGLLVGLVSAVVLVFWSAAGGIVWFYLQEGEKPAAGNLKHTIDGKTGVKVNSHVPDFNKVVNVAEGYFSITPGNDLLIARSGKPGSEIVVIPKESVDSVDFITLAGWKIKVCYRDGEWQRV